MGRWTTTIWTPQQVNSPLSELARGILQKIRPTDAPLQQSHALRTFRHKLPDPPKFVLRDINIGFLISKLTSDPLHRAIFILDSNQHTPRSNTLTSWVSGHNLTDPHLLRHDATHPPTYNNGPIGIDFMLDTPGVILFINAASILQIRLSRSVRILSTCPAARRPEEHFATGLDLDMKELKPHSPPFLKLSDQFANPAEH